MSDNTTTIFRTWFYEVGMDIVTVIAYSNGEITFSHNNDYGDFTVNLSILNKLINEEIIPAFASHGIELKQQPNEI